MSRLVLGGLIALPLALVGIPGGAVAPATSPTLSQAVALAPAAADANCADALVVAVPGAGEGGAGEPGRTLAPITAAIADRAARASRTVEVRVVAAETRGPAALRGRGTLRTSAERAVTRAAWREWRAPVGELVAGVESTLTDAVAGCQEQLVYLVGYSQGAEAVHQYVAKRAGADMRARTVAVVVVGDSARVSGSRGPILGDPAARRRAEGVSARLDRTPLPAVPADDWPPPVHSLCTAGDVACDLGDTRFRTARRTHRTYDDAPVRGEAVQLGQGLGARLSQWPLPAEGQQATGHAEMLLSERLRVRVARSARDDLRFRATSELPPGLSLSRRGVLSGVPTKADRWEVDYTVRNTTSPAVSRPMAGSITVTVSPAARAQVSAGGRHACQVRADGTLWCWGANFYGQLGDGSTRTGAEPRQVGNRSDWSDVSTGGMHTCGIRDNGTLWCWGLNYRGQLGLGNRVDQTGPRRVGESRAWESVDAGWVHTCAVRRSGTAWCWGDNEHGQLGHGDRQDRRRPVRVARGLEWRDVAAGGWHSCGVTRSGEAHCWGRNIKGQVGDGTYAMRINPAQVGGAHDWVSLAPGWTHTCGLRLTGSVSCWGSNEGGQLGGGRFGGTSTPRELGGDQTWSRIDTGVNFSCALDAGTSLWCWGTGRSGQLGGTLRSERPVPVQEGSSWAQIDLGWLFACGLEGNGSTPVCWGNDETGELGRAGTTAGRTATRSGSGYGFNLVTFNVLGSNHTSPRRDAGEFSPARIRSEWAVDYLRAVNASVVGFQEMQRDQLDWFRRAAGSTYDVWPGTSLKGNAGLQTSIAWKESTWRFVRGDTVTIPFITQERQMPLVKLEHRQTGRKIWVMNIHNAPQDHQKQRNIALRREISRLQDVANRGTPVFLVGDFNERDRAFCQVTGKLDFVAPRGGSFTDGTCHPPKGFVRIDWIFGSKDVEYSRYREDKSPLVKLMTDHAVLRTHVSVP